MRDLDLSGEWKAVASGADDADFHGFDFDDSDWLAIQVPSHWASHADLPSGQSTVFYRRRFEVKAENVERSWLKFNGVFTHASVWVDGSYAGELDGYFAGHSFEITDAINARSDHVVAVEVTAPQFDAPWPTPGGIWKPVTIEHSGSVRITRTRVLCAEARDERGVLSCHIELDATEGCEVSIRTIVTPEYGEHLGTEHEITRQLAKGANRLSWQVNVDAPELWWPWSLGNQVFFDTSIEVTDARAPHQISDSSAVRTAFRQVNYDNGYTFVNGERLFLQAIEAGSDGTPPIETGRDYFSELLNKRRELGANLVVRAHWIEPQSFYDVADELGMLIWQGIPSGPDHNPQARHARQMIEVLGHHPSVAVWLRPQKRLRDRRPAPDAIKRTLDRGDSTRSNIEQPLGWDLKRLDVRDVLAIVPRWAKRSHFLSFTSDPREAATQIDGLRLLKYKPLGGFIAPLAVPELVDGACLPVRLIAFAKDDLFRDEEAEIEIHVVNDSRSAIDGEVLSATVDDQHWSWAGRIGADSTDWVATIRVTPATDTLQVSLKLGSISERVVRIPVKRSTE